MGDLQRNIQGVATRLFIIVSDAIDGDEVAKHQLDRVEAGWKSLAKPRSGDLAYLSSSLLTLCTKHRKRVRGEDVGDSVRLIKELDDAFPGGPGDAYERRHRR